MNDSIKKSPSLGAPACLIALSSEQNAKAFDLSGTKQMNASFASRSREANTHRGELHRAARQAALALGVALSATYLLLDSLHRSTLGSFAFALLMSLVVVIATWPNGDLDSGFDAQPGDRKDPAPLEALCTVDTVLDKDDSGWQTIGLNPVTTLVVAEPKSTVGFREKQTTRKVVLDALQLVLVSGMGVVLSVMLSKTGPELELTLREPMGVHKTQPPTTTPTDGEQIVGLSP